MRRRRRPGYRAGASRSYGIFLVFARSNFCISPQSATEISTVTASQEQPALGQCRARTTQSWVYQPTVSSAVLRRFRVRGISLESAVRLSLTLTLVPHSGHSTIGIPGYKLPFVLKILLSFLIEALQGLEIPHHYFTLLRVSNKEASCFCSCVRCPRRTFSLSQSLGPARTS